MIEIEQKAPFSCFPVCTACTREGKCEKVWHTRTGAAKRTTAKPSRAAIEAISERRLANTWEMACGHRTDHDVQEIYRFWKPHGKDEYCDQCCRWQKRKPKPKAEPLPDQPPF